MEVGIILMFGIIDDMMKLESNFLWDMFWSMVWVVVFLIRFIEFLWFRNIVRDVCGLKLMVRICRFLNRSWGWVWNVWDNEVVEIVLELLFLRLYINIVKVLLKWFLYLGILWWKYRLIMFWIVIVYFMVLLEGFFLKM